MTPRTSLRSMLRQQAVTEGRGSSTFFQIPEPISVQAYVDVGMKIEIFTSPRAQEEARAWNFSKSEGPYKGGGKFGIFPSPRDYNMKAMLGIFPSPKAHMDPIY